MPEQRGALKGDQAGFTVKNLGRHAPAFPSGVAGSAAWPSPHLNEGTANRPLRCSRAPKANRQTDLGPPAGDCDPEMTTWRQPTEPATKAIEQLEGMHQLLVLWGMGLSLASGEHSRQSRLTHDPRHPIALFLMGELVAALRANDSGSFRGLLSEGIQELGVTEVEELLLDWLYSFLTAEEQDRLTGWHLGEPLTRWGGDPLERSLKRGVDSQLERRCFWRLWLF